MRVLLAIIVAFIVASSISITNAQPSANVLGGRWITASGNLEIEISRCGNTKCGKVVRVLANRSMSGSGEESSAPLAEIGQRILTEIRPRNESSWHGLIFNRENGKTYKCHLTVLDDGGLKVHAYVGISLFGRSQIWTRATTE